MTHYVHHVPGRLRVRSPALKRQEFKAREVREYMSAIEGVWEVEVNSVTGSVVIRYDTERVSSTTLLHSLCNLGLVAQHHLPAVKGRHPVQSAGSPLAGSVAQTFVNKIIEAAIERSAVALVAAVI